MMRLFLAVVIFLCGCANSPQVGDPVIGSSGDARPDFARRVMASLAVVGVGSDRLSALYDIWREKEVGVVDDIAAYQRNNRARVNSHPHTATMFLPASAEDRVLIVRGEATATDETSSTSHVGVQVYATSMNPGTYNGESILQNVLPTSGEVFVEDALFLPAGASITLVAKGEVNGIRLTSTTLRVWLVEQA